MSTLFGLVWSVDEQSLLLNARHEILNQQERGQPTGSIFLYNITDTVRFYPVG